MSKVLPRPWITGMAPYVPRDVRVDERRVDGLRRARDRPERAGVRAANQTLACIRRYSDPLGGELRRALAMQHGVDHEQILLGNGSNELVHLLVLAFAGYPGRVLCASPANRIDEVSAAVVGAEVVHVPLATWCRDLSAMASVPAEVAFVVNPRSPTGGGGVSA